MNNTNKYQSLNMILNDQIISEIDIKSCQLSLFLKGRWDLKKIMSLERLINEFEAKNYKSVQIFCQDIEYLDTAGAWLITKFIQQQKEKNIPISLNNLKNDWHPLVQSVSNAISIKKDISSKKKLSLSKKIFLFFLSFSFSFKKDLFSFFHIIGLLISSLFSKKRNNEQKNSIFTSTIVQLQKIGLDAVIIIASMGLIIGIIITQQGAFQLRKFGAEIFVVDMIGILSLREMGVLVTAILVAGRSGSAITAEIGAMKMREEVDALKIIGLDIVKILIFPRILALVIAIPLLTVVADFFAIIGGAFVGNLYSGISFDAFFNRLATHLNLTAYILGLIKTVFLALVIGFIACIEGFKVDGSAESLGKQVTSSVVKTIFMVIVVDALFAILYVALGY